MMRLTSTDAAFVYGESASGPMHISSIYVLEGVLTYQRVLQHFQARMHLVPRYRQRLLFVPGNIAHPEWVDDPGFDLANHVVAHRLPEGATLEDGIEAAIHLNEPMLDRHRPLWKVVVIEGVAERTLVLQMTHHAMIDGVSGIDLTRVLYDFDPEAQDPPPPQQGWHPEPLPVPLERFNGALRESLQKFRSGQPLALFSDISVQGGLLAKAMSVLADFVQKPAITASFNAGLVGPRRQLGWLRHDFAELREIRRCLGGTINDVVLTFVSEGVARYLQEREPVAAGGRMRIMCPVSVRREDEQGALGNRVSAIFPMLPAEPMNVEVRLQRVIDEMERIKQGGEAQAMALLAESTADVPPLALLPTQLVGTRLDPTVLAARFPLPPLTELGTRLPNPGINFTCTNVPGVQVPQYMAGHRVTDTIGILLLTGNMGLGVTILSYDKKLFCSFVCDPRLLPEVERLVAHADAAFHELLAAARALAGVPAAATA